MKNGFKAALATAVAFGMGVTPAMAGQIASPNTVGGNVDVTAPSTITATVLGWVTANCNITMDGAVTVLGTTLGTSPKVNGEVRFASGTATDISPSTSCNSGPSGAGSVNYPIDAVAISPTEIRIKLLKLTTPVGVCQKTNVLVNWNNTTKVATLPTTSAFPCTAISGSMSVPGLDIVAN